MNAFLSRTLLWCLPFLAPVAACAQGGAGKVEPVRHPFLWRIEGETVQWLYGTIHLPDKRVTTLPESVDAAIDACDILLTELEMDAKTQAMVAKATQLPKGTKLSDVLPEATYERLAAYCKSKSFPIETVAGQKAWVVLATLAMLDDLRAVMAGKALDLVLVDEAKDRHKQTAALELPAEQIGAFEVFSAAEMAQMVDATLDMLEKAAKEKRSVLRELIELYVAGDLDALHDAMESMSGLSGHAELEAKFEKHLLVDRNHRMVERMIARMTASPKTAHFFAVGAAHYPGPDGILALLAAKGYRITRVGGDPPKSEPAGKEPAKKEPVSTGTGK